MDRPLVGGVDGQDERVLVSHSMRRRPRSELLNHKLAGPSSLRYRKSKAKYPLAKRMVWQQDNGSEGTLAKKGNATIRPVRACLSGVVGKRGEKGERGREGERRSVGAMV